MEGWVQPLRERCSLVHTARQARCNLNHPHPGRLIVRLPHKTPHVLPVGGREGDRGPLEPLFVPEGDGENVGEEGDRLGPVIPARGQT